MTERLQTQGIIIAATRCRDYDCIVSLFTKDNGLIKLYIRAAFSTKKSKGAGITTPLSVVEVVFSKKQSELYTCHEISVLDHNLGLRSHLNLLNSACTMLQIVANTQHPEKQAPELYHLLNVYLKRLPFATCPLTIAESFRLKLSRFEGNFGFVSHCSICATPLTDAFISEGLAFCYHHKEDHSLHLFSYEKDLIEQLAFNRDFSCLATLSISLELKEKIEAICTF